MAVFLNLDEFRATKKITTGVLPSEVLVLETILLKEDPGSRLKDISLLRYDWHVP